MLLVIDVGNTNTVAGIYDGKKLVDNWRFSSDRSKTADEFGMFMNSMLNFSGLKKEQVTDIIISSVVPPVLVPLCHMCERYFNIKPLVVGQGLKIGLQLRYENPKEIGADRIVNAVAAYDRYAQPFVLCCLLENIWAALSAPVSAFLRKHSSSGLQSCRVLS